jgi:hypothetical protein
MTNGTFQPTSDYNDEIEELIDLVLDLDKRCPFADPGARREWVRNEIKIIAGVSGNRWISEIYGACVIAGIEDVEKQRAIAS